MATSVASLPTFSQSEDIKFLKGMDAERHRLFYNPRKWLIHQRDLVARPVAPTGESPNQLPPVDEPGPLTKTNIYGEQGVAAEGPEVGNSGDGSTSDPVDRKFTSNASNFVTSGVLKGDVLEIRNDDSDHEFRDNGRYQVISVDSPTQLTVDKDWPQGNLHKLDFTVHMLMPRFLEFPQPIPFLCKLNPTEKLLKKWGISEKRDAVIEMSIGLLDEVGLVPKIGDRFIFDYGEPSEVGVNRRQITYEVRNLFETDAYGDSGLPLHYVGLATRTSTITDLEFANSTLIALNLGLSPVPCVYIPSQLAPDLDVDMLLDSDGSSLSIEVEASITTP